MPGKVMACTFQLRTVQEREHFQNNKAYVARRTFAAMNRPKYNSKT